MPDHAHSLGPGREGAAVAEGAVVGDVHEFVAQGAQDERGVAELRAAVCAQDAFSYEWPVSGGGSAGFVPEPPLVRPAFKST